MTGWSVRRYMPADLRPILTLFCDTVHAVNARDYSPEQLDAWTSGATDADAWAARLLARQTFVAERGGQVVGFADLEDDGHLDHLYGHKEYQNVGVGTRLLSAVEDAARAKGITGLFIESSLTARPFFLRRGFQVVREQTVVRRGVALVNYPMEKELQR